MLLKNNFLLIAWTLSILVLTLIPGKAVPDVPIVGIDKVVHFILFGIEMFLTLNWLKNLWGDDKFYKAIILSFLFCILFGILIEFLQDYVPGRSSSIYDVIANSIGVVLGYFAYKIYKAARN